MGNSGGVTDQNAHPHQQGKVTLVHNGIIENYRELIADYDLQEILLLKQIVKLRLHY